MKVTQVSISPTNASNHAGRPSLTPELLAASGARYSRSNEGLDAIISKIDFKNPDKSVDSIFKMIDYGHQSIADMAPIAMFIDGITLWMAYYVWSLCPTAGGQESSTRYISWVDSMDSVHPHDLGIPEELHDKWTDSMNKHFAAYEIMINYWVGISEKYPSLVRIPRNLLEATDEKSQKQVARMKRNFAFDRARSFLPVTALTNMMMVMSARGWVNLTNHLLSHPLPEANKLGELICNELGLVAPRLLKHAVATESTINGIKKELKQNSIAASVNFTDNGNNAFLETFLPSGITEDNFVEDLQDHHNRYAHIGNGLKRTSVRFGWRHVSFAEIRDLNRHRTGNKFCPLIPHGFYYAEDQIPKEEKEDALRDLKDVFNVGIDSSFYARLLLQQGDPSYIYWTSLGTEYSFEHTTTADKFIYEAELRTGLGAHYKYAEHFHDVLSLWFEKYPSTRGLISEGTAEPE